MGHCSLFHFQAGFRVGIGSCLCITTELRIAKQRKMPLLQELQEKGDGGWGEKCLCIVFLTDQKVAS